MRAHRSTAAGRTTSTGIQRHQGCHRYRRPTSRSAHSPHPRRYRTILMATGAPSVNRVAAYTWLTPVPSLPRTFQLYSRRTAPVLHCGPVVDGVGDAMRLTAGSAAAFAAALAAVLPRAEPQRLACGCGDRHRLPRCRRTLHAQEHTGLCDRASRPARHAGVCAQGEGSAAKASLLLLLH